MPPLERYVPREDRYDSVQYRRIGRSGLLLPRSRSALAELRRLAAASPEPGDPPPRFDAGITHFDLATTTASRTARPRAIRAHLPRGLRGGARRARDLDQAGWDMWPGPYGEFGSRKYMLASLDQSLERMGLDYVDIFYSHRADPDTPLEETMAHSTPPCGRGRRCTSVSAPMARDDAGRRPDPARPGHAAVDPPALLLAAQRWIERGCWTCSTRRRRLHHLRPARAGLLTTKYLNGSGELARAHRRRLRRVVLSEDNLNRVRALNEIASRRGQTLAQMALAWTLRDRASLDAGRRVEHRAARGQPAGARQPRFQFRGAGRNRRVCRGGTPQPLGGLGRDQAVLIGGGAYRSMLRTNVHGWLCIRRHGYP